MAFVETRTERTVLEGVAPVKVLLAEDVKAGDCLGDSSGTWVLSADASAEQPKLVAGEDGKSGETITAYMMAVVKVITTVANQATCCEKVALKDTGEYQVAGAGLPDVGFVASVASDEKSAILFLCPMIPQLTVVRS